MLDFESKVFPMETISLADTNEKIVRGGRHLFAKLPQAFDGIQQIAIIGWGSQGPAQAQNLRDSLQNIAIKVVVGLRADSASWKSAQKAGFSESDGSLLEMFAAIQSSDLVLLLISDAAQAQLYKKIFASMKKGATLGLSHGFLLGYLRSINESFPAHINVIGVCPKGMGPSVRRLYEQGKITDGAGINTSFTVEQDIDGRATDYALGWSIALGAPFSFKTSLEMEYRSDIFGERGILLGAVHGIIEALYRYYTSLGESSEDAFTHSTEAITGPITETISKKGILAVYESLSDSDKQLFAELYNAAYTPFKAVLAEIYDEVRIGNEIMSVIAAQQRFDRFPMTSIEDTAMWEVGKKVRAKRGVSETPVPYKTAAVYIACMMAQIDLLRESGHCYSEVVNESVIEAVDSLNPYMHFKGVSYMIDNCSTTARLGARKWAPLFDYALYQRVFIDTPHCSHENHIDTFLSHPVHHVVDTLLQYRPKVDIFVQ